jgi:hypothetical protein
LAAAEGDEMALYEWYYRSPTNEELGPFTAADLKALVSTGRINTTMVRKGDQGRWVAAANVGGLCTSQPARPSARPSVSPPRPMPRVPASGELESVPHSDRQQAVALESASARKTSISPILLVGASVAGTLMVVGLIGLVVLLLAKSDKRSPDVAVPSNGVAAAPGGPAAQPVPVATPTNEAAKAALPSALASPEAVVKAYIGVKSWEERLQFVLNPQQVRPQMEQHYLFSHLTPSAFLPGTILSVEGPREPVGAKCLVTVDVSTSTPDAPRLHYQVVCTEDGFKIDWAESQILQRKDEDAAFRSQVGNAEVAMEVLRWRQSYDNAEIEFKLTNKSRVILDYVQITIDILNSHGDYLGNAFTNETNVRPDRLFTKEINFHNVKVGEIASWKPVLKVTVNLPNGDLRDATTIYKLNETLSGADRKPHRRLDDWLTGHWRDDSPDSPFVIKGDYFFSSTALDAVRVEKGGDQLKFSIDVLERNYSTGALKVRLLNPKLGLQFDIARADEKTLQTQLTDTSVDGNRFREVENEARPKFVSEWKWVDKTDRP